MNRQSLASRTTRVALGLAVAFGLAACGSDDGGGGASTGSGSGSGLISGNTVSPSAGESSGSFIAVVRQLIAMGADETSEPLAVQGVNAAPEDTSEPVAAL